MSQSYLTREIAVRVLNLSPRRLLELAKRGQLATREAVDPLSKRRQLVYLEADVRRLAAARASGAVARIPAPIPVPAPEPLPERPLRPWLTLAEAADYSGLPESALRSLIERGRLAALDVGRRKGGRWRIHRLDLREMRGERRGARAEAAR